MRLWPAIFPITLGLAWPSLVRAADCEVVSTGLDTTQANLQIVDTYSNQTAQVFEASDTVLTAITVWQRPTSGGYGKGKLYVMEVETTSGVVRPNESRLLLAGSELQVPAGDNIHPVEMSWSLDPPLVLPHRGQFAFEIAPLPCGAGLIVFLGRSGDPYPGGSYWNFDTGSCGPGCCPDNPWEGTIDVAFRVDFCEAPVATRPSTWGGVRAAYR